MDNIVNDSAGCVVAVLVLIVMAKLIATVCPALIVLFLVLIIIGMLQS